MRLLLLSNSTIPGLGYLEYAKDYLKDFYGTSVKRVAFVPFAGVTVNWDDYEAKVQSVYEEFGYEVFSLHKEDDPIAALDTADAIAVGGGNTFKLFHDMHETGLMRAVRKKVLDGMPFSGWSAGSNISCPTLCTTNDMPIILPKNFNGLNLIPFQINPHYLDKNPEGHGGETREDRINEFMEINRDKIVVGLREGTILRVEGDKMSLLGDRNARLFQYGKEAYELTNKDDFSFLLKEYN
ncbi:MAG: dipeptidase PepE [Bacteroidetes bacterium]|jgi:dipeptidase E|nr:dipeptidase PepE [Bacteroidota bacterium]